VGGHPKSESGERTIKLDSETRTLLELWRERQAGERAEWEESAKAWKDTGLVFTWEDGRAYHPEHLSQTFTRLVARLGLPPVRLHDLRHCAATLLAAGLHMKAIQNLLGHGSYSLTADTYTSALPQFEDAQAEAPLALARAGPRRTVTLLTSRTRRSVLPRPRIPSAFPATTPRDASFPWRSH
jgi:integrase